MRRKKNRFKNYSSQTGMKFLIFLILLTLSIISLSQNIGGIKVEFVPTFSHHPILFEEKLFELEILRLDDSESEKKYFL